MHPLVDLARRSVEEFVRNHKVLPVPDPLPPGMAGNAGVFVCIKRHGELRGCIGTFSPCARNIAEETINNALSAATRDPRFLPLTAEELDDLEYSVDVLSTPEKVAGTKDLDPKKFGLILVSGHRRGLLLPDLEGVDSVEDQMRITRLKAGISEGEKVEIFRFTVQRYQ